MIAENNKFIRVDLQLIADMIEPSSRVLDVGCGNGTLLDYLVHFKQVDGRGLELSSDGVNACISAGLSVIQGDADSDLKDYPDGAFDYVVLSQTLQTMHAPREVLGHMLRIGRRAIVSFPNFAYWRVRLALLLTGRMPISETLADQWYDTPNIHLCTIKDFVVVCHEMGISIDRAVAFDHQGKARPVGTGGGPGTGPGTGSANLMGEQAVFLLKRS